MYHCPVEVFLSVKIALGERTVPICWDPMSWAPAGLGVSSKGQLHFVHWLLFEER